MASTIVGGPSGGHQKARIAASPTFPSDDDRRLHDPPLHEVVEHGKSKALSILAHRLDRTVYYMLQREKAFDMKKFLAA